MLLAAALPASLVLFCVVLLSASVILCCIRANKRDNPAVKRNGDNGPKLTNEGIEEVYYANVGSKNDDKPEIEETYYNTVVKGICNDGSRELKAQEMYYNTIDINTRAVDPQTLVMENNCAYGNIRMHRIVN